MSKEKSVSETLNEVFSNPNFIRSAVEVYSSDGRTRKTIANFANALKYYIGTRDQNTSYTIDEIDRKWTDFLSPDYLDDEKEERANANDRKEIIKDNTMKDRIFSACV